MKTPRETIDYRGCKICIHHDETPENPFEMWDCEPPLLTFNDRWPRAYNDAPENWSEFLALLPDSCFERGKRVEFIKKFLNCSVREFGEAMHDGGCDDARDFCAVWLAEQMGEKPEGWQSAREWMDTAAAILNWGGITAVYQEIRGYCQGHVTLCLAIATPEWAEKVGAPADSLKAKMEGTIELYGQWAWGDVYGFTCVSEGQELEELNERGASVWGFYGDNHEESGLLDEAKGFIDWHLEQKAKQEKEAQNLQLAFSFE